MKAGDFSYRRAGDVAEATTALAEAGWDGKAMGGGQSLMPMMNLRLAQPTQLVDISAVPAMRGVTAVAGGVRIGAAATHGEIEDGAVPGRLGEIMARVAADIAYRAVRNRGTVGGSLAHADPAADWPSALLALGARIVVAGPAGGRTLALEDFQQGAFWVALEPEEIIEAVELDVPGPAARWSYRKYCRKPGEFAEAIAAVLHDPGGETRVVVGALDAAPALLADGAALIGADLERCREAVAGVAPGLDEYGVQLHAAMLRRALAEVAA